MDEKLTYASSGVKYEELDPIKRLILEKASSTFGNTERLRIRYRPESIGEASAVFDFLDYNFMIAFIVETLGTKILDADRIAGKQDIAQMFQGKKLYSGLGQDLVAMIVYDLNNVGAVPIGVGDILASGDSDYFKKNLSRTEQLIDGLVNGVNLARATLACGDTPTLVEIINPETLDMNGGGFGIIKPKDRFTAGGSKIKEGDTIYGFGSNGIHSNGLTLARKIVMKHPYSYAAQLDDGTRIGEPLLKHTRIYSGLLEDLFDSGVDVHYISHITGHGWKKIARANREFTYIITEMPRPQPEFEFLIRNGPVAYSEAYQTWNMGLGLAIVSSKGHESLIRDVAKKHGTEFYVLGYVEKGTRQVVLPFKENGKQVILVP